MSVHLRVSTVKACQKQGMGGDPRWITVRSAAAADWQVHKIAGTSAEDIHTASHSWRGVAADPAPVSPSPCSQKTVAVCAALADILVGSGYTIAMASLLRALLRGLRSEEVTEVAGLGDK